MKTFDFSGWATRNDVTCSDGRIIRKDAFKHNDGSTVPLVWNHQHNGPENILGHALLENREEGVYAYCSFNDTKNGQKAKMLVQHGDIDKLSIYANQLRQKGTDVMHGNIRELSLVLAGANPEAFIDTVIAHNDDIDEEAVIYTGEQISLFHAEDKKEEKPAEDKKEEPKEDEKSPIDIYNEMTKEQQEAVHVFVGMALEEASKKEEVKHSDEEEETTPDEEVEEENNENVKHSEGGNENMKANVFDQKDNLENGGVLSHADQTAILEMARKSNVGSLQAAIEAYGKEHESLAHAFEAVEPMSLFPEYKDVNGGSPELIERDMTWVGEVIRGTHKSPISRIRTRQLDARGADLRAKGYNDRDTEKSLSGNIKLMGRTTDPQTIYRKDALHRDDIIDIQDFDAVAYLYDVMKHNLYEDIALATMVGDLRDDGDPDKIKEEHIRPIWKDDELYTIHQAVDVAAAKAELQGTETGAHFGDNYIYAEAVIAASLYAREQYRGSGNLAFYCDPHLLNVMLLARDLNGRRIYESKADFAKAIDASGIHTAEQFSGLVRTDKDGKKFKLLGIFVNLKDYNHGSTKGGELTRFEQFDIDYNMNKYLIESRLSGALTKIKSAIVLEEPIDEVAG